jgi:hypothetical protein
MQIHLFRRFDYIERWVINIVVILAVEVDVLLLIVIPVTGVDIVQAAVPRISWVWYPSRL